MPEPRLSVIVPVRDGALFLGAALGSLARHGGVDEILVVDDGSSDDSAAIALAAGARVLRQEPRGAAAARNRGVEAARGGRIGFLDADDLWVAPGPGGDPRLAALDADPGLPGAWGQAQILLSPPGGPESLFARPFHATTLSSLVLRREAFAQVGPFAEDLVQIEDLDWFLRARRLGLRFARVPQVTHLYRRHGANMTADPDRRRRLFLTALKRDLDRRRAERCG